MKFILLAVVLSLAACDKPAAPKIAAPQREVLEKAQGVNQMVQDATDATKKQIDQEGK